MSSGFIKDGKYVPSSTYEYTESDLNIIAIEATQKTQFFYIGACGSVSGGRNAWVWCTADISDFLDPISDFNSVNKSPDIVFKEDCKIRYDTDLIKHEGISSGGGYVTLNNVQVNEGDVLDVKQGDIMNMIIIPDSSNRGIVVALFERLA